MKNNRKLAALMVGIFMTMAIIPAGDVSTVHAAPDNNNTETKTTTQDKIDQKTQQKKEMEGVLDDTADNVDYLRSAQASLHDQLEELNEQLEEVSIEVEELEEQIILAEADISRIEKELTEAREKEDEQYNSMVIRTRDMYELNENSYFTAIISAGGLGDMLNTADYFEKIANYDRRMLNELKATRTLVQDKEEELRAQRAIILGLKQSAEEKRITVQELIEKTTNTISQFGDQIAAEEKKALEYEKAIREQEKDLEYLKRKLAEEQSLSLQAANSTWREISDVTFEEGDRYLLANLIYCEAGGEPYAGQVAVGSVVMNRMMSAVFPNTVAGVIYQKNQFSPVGSGRLALALAVNKATDSCYRAADEAMSGVTNVGNCLFFRTPIEGLTGISIGGHIFY